MRVAIVGGAPSSEMGAPFLDESWQTWVLGNRCHKYPRFDRIFEIHDDRSEHGPEYDQSLVARNIPMIVGEKFPIKAPHVKVFPFADIDAMWGGLYLTSTPAYMVALAILEGVKELSIYGCDMAVDDAEYFWQRPCLEAWLGYVKGLDIQLTIAPQSPVLKSHYIEGRDHGRPKNGPFNQNGFRTLADAHAKRAAEAQAQIEQLQRTILAHDGARQSYERMAKVARAVEGGQPIQQLTDGVVIK